MLFTAEEGNGREGKAVNFEERAVFNRGLRSEVGIPRGYVGDSVNLEECAILKVSIEIPGARGTRTLLLSVISTAL